ncbi:MAG: hypothetical protein EOM51_10705 [Clostridia bacterium]|nr:hypothetical protein [Clostridia bacterium]
MLDNSMILRILADKNLNEQLVEHFQICIKSLPGGSLCRKMVRGKERFYHYTYCPGKPTKRKGSEKQVYLSKEDQALKEALQQKAYIEKALIHLARNITAEKQFLSQYHPFDPTEIGENLPKPCKDLDLIKIMNCTGLHDSDDANELPQQATNDKTLYAEGLVHCTSKGLKVRSKSESLIATLLDMNGIEYRYEMSLTLGDHTFRPDFTMMRPSDRKLFYWEHFGMMSNPSYHERAQKKLQEYIKHGLMPWDRLIATFESNEDSFDAQQADKIIKALLS